MRKERTGGVAGLDGERIDEEVEPDGVAARATGNRGACQGSTFSLTEGVADSTRENSRSVGVGVSIEAELADKRGVDIVKHVGPDLTDICQGETRLSGQRKKHYDSNETHREPR